LSFHEEVDRTDFFLSTALGGGSSTNVSPA
jgi:hypothetical protein